MVQFSTTIQKFKKQGEKTGWTYINVPAEIALQLVPGNKKSFRVKGTIDQCAFEDCSLLPMGEGDFILTINATMRKCISKPVGSTVQVKLVPDKKPFVVPADILDCMADEPGVSEKFLAMPQSHQRYYIKWIESAKTEQTRAKRIAMTISSFINNMDFGQMLRAARQQKDELK